jgi:hypothetical protein
MVTLYLLFTMDFNLSNTINIIYNLCQNTITKNFFTVFTLKLDVSVCKYHVNIFVCIIYAVYALLSSHLLSLAILAFV